MFKGSTSSILVSGVVFAMVATAVLLPGRQSVPVLKAIGATGEGVISTAEGR